MVATPTWTVLPFIAYLLLIAVLPLVAGRMWEHNRNKLLLACLAGGPVVFHLLRAHPSGGRLLLETGGEYVAFMALLGALFVISGGIYVRGALSGTPRVNTLFLLVGALLASIIGTTGASALLIRPLLRANEKRKHIRHLVIFFIFIVSNGGGLLTPLGDPPLFLGFLRGVPFGWTLRLLPTWALVNSLLLFLFVLFDRRAFAREKAEPAPPNEALRIEGGLNFLWLAGVIAVVFCVGYVEGPARSLVQVAFLSLLGFLSLKITPARIHEANRFTWAPILEVAAVFVGVFVTMVPALSFLEERGASLGITRPWQFFWASGALSSVLDNAPTYLTFASLASGVAQTHGNLGVLAAHPVGEQLLAAVSCGSVLMGAVTYIGNGPNFMVKAIAEQHHVRMPSFFGYALWSLLILIPIFGIVALVFFGERP